MTVAGERLDGLSSGQLAKWRARHVGFVFQFYNLMSMFSAARNVEPLLLTSSAAQAEEQRAGGAGRGRPRRSREAQAGGIVRWPCASHVAIARALVADPTLLVCDEPTGDLDRKTADDILHLLQTLNREHGKSIVMVTHDPKAADFASRQLHLDKGLLVGTEVAAA